MFFRRKPNLDNVRVAVLAVDGVEQRELTEPWRVLKKAGAEVFVLSVKLGTLQSVRKLLRGDKIPIDGLLDEVRPSAFDALFIPGIIDPQAWKKNDKAVAFVRHFVDNNKPIAALSSAPILLAEAGDVEGVQLTSTLKVRPALERAGALWVDQPVVEDELVLTGQSVTALKAFNKKLVGFLARTV